MEEEREAVAVFRIQEVNQAEIEPESTMNLNNILKKQADLDARIAQGAEDCHYRSTKHVLPTSNVIERLFSRAKGIMTATRKCMSPYRLEELLYLQYNRSLWDDNTIQDILNGYNPDTDATEFESDDEFI